MQGTGGEVSTRESDKNARAHYDGARSGDWRWSEVLKGESGKELVMAAMDHVVAVYRFNLVRIKLLMGDVEDGELTGAAGGCESSVIVESRSGAVV